MSRLIIKEYRDYKEGKLSFKQYLEMVENIGKELEKHHWIYSMIEGGYISPDFSSIYIDDRSPYYGQLLLYRRDAYKDYEEICNKLLESGKFKYFD